MKGIKLFVHLIYTLNLKLFSKTDLIWDSKLSVSYIHKIHLLKATYKYGSSQTLYHKSNIHNAQ